MQKIKHKLKIIDEIFKTNMDIDELLNYLNGRDLSSPITIKIKGQAILHKTELGILIETTQKTDKLAILCPEGYFGVYILDNCAGCISEYPDLKLEDFTIDALKKDLNIKSTDCRKCIICNSKEFFSKIRDDYFYKHGYSKINEKKIMVRWNRTREIICIKCELLMTCPICNNRNHASYLRNFINSHDPDKIIIKKQLYQIIHKFQNNISLKIGIPCCNCFDSIFNRI